jgi:hypothetical protein
MKVQMLQDWNGPGNTRYEGGSIHDANDLPSMALTLNEQGVGSGKFGPTRLVLPS